MLSNSIKPARARCVKRTRRGIGEIPGSRDQVESYDAAANAALGGIIARSRIYSALRFQAPVPSLPEITAIASWIS